MAVGIGFSFLGKALGGIGQYLVDPISRQFGYLFCFNTNIQNLETQLDSLKVTREGVQLGVDETRNNVRTVGPHLEAWLTRGNDNTAEAETIIKDKAQVQKGCFNGWCPNLKLRYSLGRKAVKKTQELALLLAEGSNYIQSSYNPPPPSIEPIPTTTEFQGFDSRILVMNEIIEALKDDGIHLIGICGMGGMGKTTMAKEVAKRTKNLFNEFPMAVVSQEPDLTKVQGCIADMLGLKLDDRESPIARASLLRKRLLLDNKKILVILDDIWEEFDLEELGFPLEGGNNKSCKILFTSRNRNLWKGIQNKRYIQLQVLVGEEPWHLFREKVGDCADDLDLLPLAKDIVNECGGLPLALVTIGRALTNERNQHHWNNALQQLRTPCSESLSSEVPAKVYQALYFSYNFLKDERAKKLFLLCCLFLEDYNISIEDMVRYGIGLRWFEGIDKVDEVRDRVNVLVDQLKSCYLLLDGRLWGQIKMHDVVRDVAISIAAKDKHGFMTIHGVKLREWPKKATYELNTSISVISHKIVEFPGRLRCSKLEFLLIQCWNSSLKIPSNFFEGMRELKVLDLAIMKYISLLPSSLQFLSNLLTLHLDQCQKIDNISVIGKLLNLEILSFRGSDIKELPKEIRGLVNLKLLDLTRCYELERIAPGVISALVQLQELYMGGCLILWEREGKEGGENASLREFESLSNLNTLEITIKDVVCLPRIPLFSKLTKYSILIGYDANTTFDEEYIKRLQKILSLDLHDTCTIPLDYGGINLLLRSTAVLQLMGKGSDDTVQELLQEGVEGLQHLKELLIQDCATPECLVNTMEWVPRTPNATSPIFPILEELELRNLPNLRKICHCQLLTGSFGKLSHLEIKNCDRMEEVIWKEKGEDDATNKMEFPALESMTLWRLPMLISICRGIDEIEFPQLKTLYLWKLPQLKWLFLNSSNPFSESMENHNATFLSLFPHKVALPSLEELDLKDLDNLEGLGHIPISVTFPGLEKLVRHGLQNMSEIWCNQLQTGSFNKLIKLYVSDCGSLRNLFSLFMARHLVHLKRLVINKCLMMEEVVAKEEDEEEQEQEGRINGTPLPKLEYLKLKDLPELQSFCHVTHNWELPLVKHITVLNCPKMKTFSPGVICTPKLQRVFVKEGKFTWLPGREGEDWLWISDLNQTITHLIDEMADNVLHDDAPLEVPPPLSPPVEVEESVIAEAGKATEGIAADFDMEFAPELELETLPLRVRPSDPMTYHPRTHMISSGGIRHFDDFIRGMPEDLLLRELYSHLSYGTSEGDSRSHRGYGAMTAREWYYELPPEVRNLVDEAGFGLFCTGLSCHLASQALLEALVERWWDTTNSFHLSTAEEMTMTPYDFAMITGLGVGGDPIPFDMQMGKWEAAWIHLLGARPPLYRPGMVRYSWFPEHFRGSEPKTPEEVEQYVRGFLMFLLGTTLFTNRWNTVGLYLLSALVTLPRVQFYDWGGAGLATLYGYMTSTSRMMGERVGGYWRAWELWVYAYFPTLAPEPIEEITPVVPYSRRYDGRCRCRSRDDMTFAFYRRYFDTVVADKIMWQPWATMPAGVRDQYTRAWAISRVRILLEGPVCRAWFLGERFIRQTLGSPISFIHMPPSASMRIADSLSDGAVIQFIVGPDADYFRAESDNTAFIETHLIPPLTSIRTGDVAGTPLVGDAAQEIEASIGEAPSIGQLAGWPVIPTALTCWRPTGSAYQIPIEPPEAGHGYVRARGASQASTEYSEGLLQLVASLIGMVQRREILLDLHGIQIPSIPRTPAAAAVAPPPATGRRGRQAPAHGRDERRG